MRIIVVQMGKSWQATARDGAFWAVGDFCSEPEDAMQNAMKKLRESIPRRPVKLEDLLC